MRHEIWISSWRPTPLNVLLSLHWAKRRERKIADVEMISAYCMKDRIPRAKADQKRRVSLKIYLQGRQKKTDPDALWKVVLDGLVACDALYDDGAEFCELGTVEFFKGHKVHGSLIILEDVP